MEWLNQEGKSNSPEILECRYCSLDDLPKPISKTYRGSNGDEYKTFISCYWTEKVD